MKRAAELPDGWTRQAFRFALDAPPSVVVLLIRHVGMRRKAYNWAVEQCKNSVDGYNAWKELCEIGIWTGEKPESDISLAGLRKRWNTVKPDLCCDDDGNEWWRELSKEAAAAGISDCVDGYWRHMTSERTASGRKAVGFPKFKRKGSCGDSYRITTGAYGSAGRRHVKIPRVGLVRTHESMSKLMRLVDADDATIGSMTVTAKASAGSCRSPSR